MKIPEHLNPLLAVLPIDIKIIISAIVFYGILFVATLTVDRKRCNQIWLWSSIAFAVCAVAYYYKHR